MFKKRKDKIYNQVVNVITDKIQNERPLSIGEETMVVLKDSIIKVKRTDEYIFEFSVVVKAPIVLEDIQYFV